MKNQINFKNGYTAKTFKAENSVAIGAKLTDGMLVDAMVYVREGEDGRPEIVINQDVIERIEGNIIIEKFDTDKPSKERDTRISGVMFEHGTDDFGFWEGFHLTDAEEAVVYQILSRHDTEGCSVHGTRKDIVKEME